MLYQFLHQVTVCFYWSHNSFMDEVVALQLGFMAVIFVSQHWDNFGDELSVVLSDGNVVIHSQQYAQYMNTSGVYGGEAEIVLMSKILPARMIISFRGRPHNSPRVYNAGQHLYIYN